MQEHKRRKPSREVTVTEEAQYHLSSFCPISYDQPKLYLYPSDETQGTKIITTWSPLGFGRLELREALNGKVLRTLQWRGNPFRCVLALGDGKIATGQYGSAFVKIWDVETGTLLEEWDTLMQGMEKKWAPVCVHGLSHLSAQSATLITSTLIESLQIAKDVRSNTQAPPPSLWNSFVCCWDRRMNSRSKAMKPFLTRDFIYQFTPSGNVLNEVVMVTSYADASAKYSTLQRWQPETGDRRKLKKPQVKHQSKIFDSQINCVGLCGSRENAYALVCGSAEGSLSRWQFVKGDSRPNFKLLSGRSPSGIQDLAVQEHGVVISISKRGDINFWDLESDSCMTQAAQHSSLPLKAGEKKGATGFHSLLATKGREFLTYDQNGLVKVWNYRIEKQ